MSNMKLHQSALAAALALALSVAACGGDDSTADPYLGYIDGTVLPSNLLPQTASFCGAARTCYGYQKAWANGKPLYFYNLGAYQTSRISLAATSATKVFTAVHTCTPGTQTDSRTVAFPNDQQFAIWTALPASNNTLPLGAAYSVEGVITGTCNDIKSHTSVAAWNDPGAGGLEGGKSSPAPSSINIMAVIDGTAAINKLGSNAANPGGVASGFVPKRGWYKGLQLAYLDGGAVPTDANGNLIVMDGAILNITDGTATGQIFSLATADDVVVLPAVPGQPGYSPIARLHNIIVSSKSQIGAKGLTSICAAKPCPAGSIDLSTSTDKAGFNTVFMASAPQ